MNKKISLGLAISLVAIVSAITFILTYGLSMDIFNSKVNVKERPAMNRKLEAVDNAVRSAYIGTLDEQALVDAIARGYVSGVGDPYAAYYSVEQYQTNKLKDSGYMIGIGISVETDASGYILVKDVDAKTPAAEVGIEVGDIIVAVDGVDVLSLGYQASLSSMAGEEGTLLKITVRRSNQDYQYQMVRRKLENITVDYSVIEENVGYIKITGFDGRTGTQFVTALSELRGKQVKGYVVDLRNNLGGLISAIDVIMSQLTPAGDLVTATYQNGVTEVMVSSSGVGSLEEPISVLVNSRTASSAEILACCLRDYANAKLVGTNTFGKGVKQDIKELSDGSAIKITTARYQTTKTPCFDGIGLKPSVEVAMVKDDVDSLRNVNMDTDMQLRKAVEIVKPIE